MNMNLKYVFGVEVDDTDAKELRNFHLFEDGTIIPEQMGIEMVYVDTVFMNDGFLYHVYERFGL